MKRRLLWLNNEHGAPPWSQGSIIKWYTSSLKAWNVSPFLKLWKYQELDKMEGINLSTDCRNQVSYDYSCAQKRSKIITVVSEEGVYDSLNNKHSLRCFQFKQKGIECIYINRNILRVDFKQWANKKHNLVVNKLFHSSFLQHKKQTKGQTISPWSQEEIYILNSHHYHYHYFIALQNTIFQIIDSKNQQVPTNCYYNMGLYKIITDIAQ